MRILTSNLKKGLLKLLPESMDDLWAVHAVLAQGDRVEAKTMRKIKATEEAKAEKRAVWLAITVDRWHIEGETLRIFGSVVEGTEEVPRGSAHTISVKVGNTVTIIKPAWQQWQLTKLKSPRQPSVLIVVHDREEAFFAALRPKGYELVGQLRGAVAKKGQTKVAVEDFFARVAKEIAATAARLKAEHVIVASPAFWKEMLAEKLPPELKRKTTLASCSSADEQAINEVLRRPELKTALASAQATRELELMERVLAEVRKGGKVVYGIDAVETAAQQGAIEELLLSEGLLERAREENWSARLDKLLRDVEKAKGTVRLISSTSEAGKRLLGIGGIAGLLRWQME